MFAEIFSETGFIVIAIALLLMFGSSKLPDLARSLGRTRTEFEKGLKEGVRPDESGDASA